MKKLLPSIPAILMLGVLAAPAVAAEPASEWYARGHLLAEGETVPVRISGQSSIYVGSFGFRVTCHAAGTGTVANVENHGTESVSALTFSNCVGEQGGSEKLRTRICPSRTKPEIVAEGLPWSGSVSRYLLATYEGVQLAFSCSGQGGGSPVKGTIGGLVDPHGLQFAQAPEQEPTLNVLGQIALFTGVWHLEGPEGRRAVTAIFA